MISLTTLTATSDLDFVARAGEMSRVPHDVQRQGPRIRPRRTDARRTRLIAGVASVVVAISLGGGFAWFKTHAGAGVHRATIASAATPA